MEKEFEKWKSEIRTLLPEKVVKFYSNPPSEIIIHKQLGQLIKDINDPLYGYVYDGKQLDKTNQLAFKYILEIQVEEMFKFIDSI